MKARLTQTMRVSKITAKLEPKEVVWEDGIPYKSEGTIIDHPQAYRLVHGGLATPEDDECRECAEAMDAERPKLIGKLAAAHNRYLEENQAAMDEAMDAEFEAQLEEDDEE